MTIKMQQLGDEVGQCIKVPGTSKSAKDKSGFRWRSKPAEALNSVHPGSSRNVAINDIYSDHLNSGMQIIFPFILYACHSFRCLGI